MQGPNKVSNLLIVEVTPGARGYKGRADRPRTFCQLAKGEKVTPGALASVSRQTESLDAGSALTIVGVKPRCWQARR